MIRRDVFLKYLGVTKDLEGDIIEVGVHQGNSLGMIARIANGVFNLGNKQIYGVDTLSGMPSIVIDGLDNGWDDYGNPGIGGHKSGDFSDTSIQDVMYLTNIFNNVKLIWGIFPQCADKIPIQKFCFAHVDVDIYQSYKDTYQFLWPRIVSGGVIICGDDYARPWLKGAKLAIDEVSEEFGVTPIITPERVHILIKP